MIFNMVGGGGGSGATLVVSSPVNVSVTVSKDDKSYTKNSGSLGSTTFKGLATGTWTVTISGNGQTATKTIEITADYAITITFFSAFINITYPATSTCVVTDSSGQTVASDTNTGSSTKTWTATVNAKDTYTVTATATDGSGKSKSQSVSITADGQSVSVTLSYQLVLFENGSLASGYSVGGSMSIANGYLQVSVREDGNAQGYVSPTIDVTNYSTMRLIAKQTPIPNSGHRIGLSEQSTNSFWDNGFAASVSNIANSDTEYSVDISALSGNYYFRMSMYSGSLYCSKVWFE